MKGSKWSITIVVVTFVASAYAEGSGIDIGMLNQNMLDACPAVWEDIKIDIDPAQAGADVWDGDASDKETFKAFLSAAMGPSAPPAAELEVMAGDPSTVASECATQRIAFMDALLSRMPNDALQAMSSVLDQLDVAADAVEHGGWRIGNVRVTGRAEPAPGWIFLTGQTVGNPGTSADLRGTVMEELFELAKHWYPNTGDESWTDGDVVTLPDMRGRAIVGANSMGGTPSGVLTAANADQVGGTFGQETHQLTVAEMPAHTHGMGSAGKHSHSYTYRGHESGVKSGSGATAWKSNQSQSTNSKGGHRHSLTGTGGNQPHNIVQPSLAFNVEMKFAVGGNGDLVVNQPPPEPELLSGLRWTCYSDTSLASASGSGVDSQVSFDSSNGGWGTTKAGKEEQFSCMWEGYLNLPTSESVTFFTNSDDGVRLYVDGSLIIDNWTLHAPTEDSGSYSVIAGQDIPIRLEYFQELGGATIELMYQSATISKSLIAAEHLFHQP